jgi:endogenous inhibitor of DNA gyrase (YacG/DUF329 family)
MAEPARPLRPCPICGKPAVSELRPFCSRRCAEVDLGRWLTGQYRVPATASDEDADASGTGAEQA